MGVSSIPQNAVLVGRAQGAGLMLAAMILQPPGYHYVWCHCLDCGHYADRPLELTPADRRLRCTQCGSRNCERRIVWTAARPDNVIELTREPR